MQQRRENSCWIIQGESGNFDKARNSCACFVYFDPFFLTDYSFRKKLQLIFSFTNSLSTSPSIYVVNKKIIIQFNVGNHESNRRKIFHTGICGIIQENPVSTASENQIFSIDIYFMLKSTLPFFNTPYIYWTIHFYFVL